MTPTDPQTTQTGQPPVPATTTPVTTQAMPEFSFAADDFQLPEITLPEGHDGSFSFGGPVPVESAPVIETAPVVESAPTFDPAPAFNLPTPTSEPVIEQQSIQTPVSEFTFDEPVQEVVEEPVQEEYIEPIHETYTQEVAPDPVQEEYIEPVQEEYAEPTQEEVYVPSTGEELHPDTPITASFGAVKKIIQDILDLKHSTTKPHSFFVQTNEDEIGKRGYTFFENKHSVIVYKKKFEKDAVSGQTVAIKLGFTSFVYNNEQIDVTYKDSTSSSLEDKKGGYPFCTFVDQKYDYTAGEPEAINGFLDRMMPILQGEYDTAIAIANQRSESVNVGKVFLESF